MIKILQTYDEAEDKILRAICVPVKQNEFKSEQLLSDLKKMKESAHQQEDGVALAAPQIGINKRIFVIDERAYKNSDLKWMPTVFINPTITKTSKTQEIKDEGCLSVRKMYGSTWRSVNVSVTAYDQNGTKFSYGAGGLIAHIIQHEMDHLDGILFIDHGFDLEEREIGQ